MMVTTCTGVVVLVVQGTIIGRCAITGRHPVLAVSTSWVVTESMTRVNGRANTSTTAQAQPEAVPDWWLTRG